jgi:myo-inositol 2-dehydrogenase/D-chiro-inositol 1-dehydrogenase
MEEFIKCIQENKEPSVGGFDGKISVQMGYAAKESLTRGSFVKVTK